MTEANKADWLAVACDEGAMQVWALKGEQVLATEVQPTEVGDAEAFADALMRITASWSLPAGLPIFVTGLPPLGWCATAPRPVPCDAIPPQTAHGKAGPFDLQIIPGLRQAEPAGLTQGAETRIAGFLSLNKDWDGVICLPGAQTVWAQVSAGEVVSFQGFLTGEMRSLLDRDAPAAADTALDDTAWRSATGCRGPSGWRNGWPRSGPNRRSAPCPPPRRRPGWRAR